MTGGEGVAATALALFAAPVVVSYLADALGFTIAPLAMLVAALAAAAGAFLWLLRRAKWEAAELVAYAASVGGVCASLAWLARPGLLPRGHGPDLAHHLMLIEYIEQHWRLPHDAALWQQLGEFLQYTPGSHVLTTLAGAWARTDGFHAVFPVLAASVALTAGFVFLIARRVMPRDVPATPWAILCVVLLFVPRAYFIGSFAHDFFLAQVVSELFAVAMWWAIVAWDTQPSIGAMGLFAVAGVAAFLTWPIWIGPPLVALALVVLLHGDLPPGSRIAQAALAVAPIAIVAVAYVAGRTSMLAMVGTSGGVTRPSIGTLGWWFLIPSAAGLFLAATRREGRSTALFLFAIALQAGVFYVIATLRGADTPYMALKMMYVSIYPLAVCAALAIATLFSYVGRGLSRAAGGRARGALAWVLVMIISLAVGRHLAAAPRDAPVVSEPLYQAGVWARTHVPPSCVEYLVVDPDTAYWLHLAVLGNPRVTARTVAVEAHDLRRALVSWIEPGGLPYAIADLSATPADVRRDADVVALFGTAAVLRRRGPSSCHP